MDGVVLYQPVVVEKGEEITGGPLAVLNEQTDVGIVGKS